MLQTCALYQLGLVEYQQAWRFQEKLAEKIGQGKHPPALLLLEHPHTYTFGRRGQIENLVWDEAERARRGVQVLWVDRGGDVTYHGPGQLVGYPLIPLSAEGLVQKAGEPPRLPQADYVGYVRRLEKVIIAALAQFGVCGIQVPERTGVWVERKPQAPAKLAAIGVKVDVHGISRHGFAINLAPDMAYWDGIIGCGLKDAAVTSLAEILNPAPTMQALMEVVATSFGRVFAYELTETPNPFTGKNI